MTHRILHLVWPLAAVLLGVAPAQAIDGVGAQSGKLQVPDRDLLNVHAGRRTKHTNQDKVDPPEVPDDLVEHTNQDRTPPEGEEPPPPSPGTPLVRPVLRPLGFFLLSDFFIPLFGDEAAIFAPYMGGAVDRTDGVLPASLGIEFSPFHSLDFQSPDLSRNLAPSQVTIQVVPAPAVLSSIGLAAIFGRQKRRHT